MDAETILGQIQKFEARLLVKGQGGAEVAPPHILVENIVKIRVLLVQLVDIHSNAEREYKLTRASKYDELIKEGVKPSPAGDKLKMDKDLIELEIAADRLKNYMKYIDSLVSSVQTAVKVQTGIAKSEL